jgi:hypothetical protein
MKVEQKWKLDFAILGTFQPRLWGKVLAEILSKNFDQNSQIKYSAPVSPKGKFTNIESSSICSMQAIIFAENSAVTWVSPRLEGLGGVWCVKSQTSIYFPLSLLEAPKVFLFNADLILSWNRLHSGRSRISSFFILKRPARHFRCQQFDYIHTYTRTIKGSRFTWLH